MEGIDSEERSVKRRDLFKAGAVTGAALVLPTHRLVSAAVGQAISVTPFSVPLRIPPVLQPVRRTFDTDYYEVTQREADIEIVPGTTTSLFTYNGQFPGPTIGAYRGRRVVVAQNNTLANPTAVHLHGGHVAPQHDGYPIDVINPGGSRTYVYPNQQRATTLWYHDHAHHLEAENVFRGLGGFYLIRDGDEFGYGLPTGQYDVPLMFRDIRLDDNAQVVFALNDFEGRGIVLVNGRPQPYFRVAARKYRFRLLNGSNDRGFRFNLSNGANFVQLASDGGFLPAKVITPSIELFPAERADVVVDFTGLPTGTHVILENLAGESDAARQLMRFEIDRTATDNSRIPNDHELPAMPPLETPVVTRDITLALDPNTFVFLLNGKSFDPNRVDFTVRRDQPEVWRITNTDPFGIPHSLHLHLTQFRVLDRNGTPPGPGEAGWKDTVTVRAGQTVRIAAKFTSYTGRYVFHCHLIDHSTRSMMAQVEIVP
jgi:FtsP/CotA-like multicopper oxidase with cupredoxin domain